MHNFNHPIESSSQKLGQLMMERYAEQVRKERERQQNDPFSPAPDPTLEKTSISTEGLKNPYRGVDMPVAK